jgi:hypothetical protein
VTKIADIFADDINRKIEEVIKVGALDDEILVDEIKEYYPTQSIQKQMAGVLEAYSDVHRGPTQDIGVWVSGFFGSGKSSFAKLVGVLLEDRKLGKHRPAELFGKRITDDRIKVLLQQIREHLPTHVVMFDILTDQQFAGGAQEHPVTAVMYRALLRSLRYPTDLDLAELEINLEQKGELAAFESKFSEVYNGRTWAAAKRLVMTAINEASTVLHHLDGATYPAPDSWARSRVRAGVSPRLLAERALALAQVRAGGRNVAFVVDEIGQYAARDLSRIGDLQGVVESFSRIGKGKLWLIATSQEKLEAIVDIYESSRSDLVRLQDRFAHKVFLNPADIREVASHRVLSKKAQAEQALRQLYQKHSGQLRSATKVAGAVELPQLEEDSFVRLYPLLPYQVDLLIDVVSGLRRQGGGPSTMGGANRTIIKLAQQLLVHPKVGLAEEQIGRVVTLNSVYDLISTNVSTEMQQEIDEVERQIEHPFAGPVAKALALLQFAEAIYPTEENIAAVLHPGADSASVLADVREAVEKLIDARKIRRTERGLKIQSAAERTWDEERDGRLPTPGDRKRILKDTLEQIWGKGAQAPNCQLGGWKKFSAALRVGSEALIDGDVTFEVAILEESQPSDRQIQEARARTQADDAVIAWTVELSADAEKAVVERFRTDRMLSRGARTKDEEPLLREETRRKTELDRRLRTELEKALCRGHVFFRGNDRSPGDEAKDPRVEARRVLASALEAVYHRFRDGKAQVRTVDVEAILKSDNLAGLPACYAELGVVKTVDGQVQLVTEQVVLKEVLEWVKERSGAARAPSGKELEQHFKSAPYGWALELVQLAIAGLLRSGAIELTAQGARIRTAVGPEARACIPKNTQFRSTTIRVREDRVDPTKVRRAAQLLQERFGLKVPSLTAGSVAVVARTELGKLEPALEGARDTLRELGLPGLEILVQTLDALRLIRESTDTLAKGIPRGRAIAEQVTDPVRHELEQARSVARSLSNVLGMELGEDHVASKAVVELDHLLAKETFYEHLPQIRSAAETARAGFVDVYQEAFEKRRTAYEHAREQLRATAGWTQLSQEDQESVEERLRQRAEDDPANDAWRMGAAILATVRAERDAAIKLLTDAQDTVRRMEAGPNLVTIDVTDLLEGAIRTPEDLEAAVTAIREAVAKAISDGNAVILK